MSECIFDDTASHLENSISFDSDWVAIEDVRSGEKHRMDFEGESTSSTSFEEIGIADERQTELGRVTQHIPGEEVCISMEGMGTWRNSDGNCHELSQ